MDASPAPSVKELQLHVRALSDAINRDDAGSVESLQAFLHQIRACTAGVSKRLEATELAREKAKKEELAREKAKKEELAREKAKKEEELAREKAKQTADAKKELLAKAIWDQIAALTAKLHELQGVVPPVMDVPVKTMPPPAPRPVGRVVGGPEAKRAKKDPVRGKSPVGRGGKALTTAAGRGKAPPVPPFTGGGGVPASEAETQVLDDFVGDAPYEGDTQPPEF